MTQERLRAALRARAAHRGLDARRAPFAKRRPRATRSSACARRPTTASLVRRHRRRARAGAATSTRSTCWPTRAAASPSSRPTTTIDVVGFAVDEPLTRREREGQDRGGASRSRRIACRAAARGARSSRARRRSRASCRRRRRCRSCRRRGDEVGERRTNGRAQVHRRRTSPSSRGSSRSASAPACTSAASTRAATTTCCGRSSTTRSTRSSTATPRPSGSRSTRTASGVTVEDDGRGIPVDFVPKYKKNALELILCTLHAGGKFEQGNYIHSGGLHGVGSSVVNALSEELIATVRRDGARARADVRARQADDEAQGVEQEARGTGTAHLLPARPGDLRRQAAVRRRPRCASGSRPRPTCTAACTSSSRTRRPARRSSSRTTAASPTTWPRSSAERGKPPIHPGAFDDDEGRAARRDRAAVDRGDRRAHPLLRQRHPDRRRRHARERAASRAWSRRCATSSRRTT